MKTKIQEYLDEKKSTNELIREGNVRRIIDMMYPGHQNLNVRMTGKGVSYLDADNVAAFCNCVARFTHNGEQMEKFFQWRALLDFTMTPIISDKENN